MNDNPTNIPPQIPPQINSGNRPLGEDPAEREPITSPIGAIEALLRRPRRLIYQLRQPGAGGLVVSMFFISILCAAVYGVVVGTFSMHSQLWIAPVKIAGGLLATSLICLPSLYIFTCLSGSQARLGEVAGLLAGLLMLMTILLVGFAPVALIFSTSTDSLEWMGTLHLLFWFIATIFGLRFIRAGFAHSEARSHAGFNTWVIIFVLVSLQMTTALRPIVDRSDTFFPTEKKFFLKHWLDHLDSSTRRSRNSL